MVKTWCFHGEKHVSVVVVGLGVLCAWEVQGKSLTDRPFWMEFSDTSDPQRLTTVMPAVDCRKFIDR